VDGETDASCDGAKGGKGAGEDEVEEEDDAGGREGEQMAAGKEGVELEGGGEEKEAAGESAEDAGAEEDRANEFGRHDCGPFLGDEQHVEEAQRGEGGGDGECALWDGSSGGGFGRREGNAVAAAEGLAALGDPAADIETGAPHDRDLLGVLVVGRQLVLLLVRRGIAAAQPAPVVLVGLRDRREGTAALAAAHHDRRAQGL